LFLVQLYRWCPSILRVVGVVQPDRRQLASGWLSPLLARQPAGMTLNAAL
jgi:hypothetical protein